jgi:hypothetical protein
MLGFGFVIFKNRDGYLRAFNQDKHNIKGKQIHLRQTHTRKEMKNRRIKTDLPEPQNTFTNFAPYYLEGGGRNIHSDYNLEQGYTRNNQQEPNNFFKSAFHIRKPDYIEPQDHYYQANSEYGQDPIGFGPMIYGFNSERKIENPLPPKQAPRTDREPQLWSQPYPNRPYPYPRQAPQNPNMYPPNQAYPPRWQPNAPRPPPGPQEYPAAYGRGSFSRAQMPVNREFYSERKMYPQSRPQEAYGAPPPGYFRDVRQFGSAMDLRQRGGQRFDGRGYYGEGGQVPYGSMRDMYSGGQRFPPQGQFGHREEAFGEGEEDEDATLVRANVPF